MRAHVLALILVPLLSASALASPRSDTGTKLSIRERGGVGGQPLIIEKQWRRDGGNGALVREERKVYGVANKRFRGAQATVAVNVGPVFTAVRRYIARAPYEQFEIAHELDKKDGSERKYQSFRMDKVNYHIQLRRGSDGTIARTLSATDLHSGQFVALEGSAAGTPVVKNSEAGGRDRAALERFVDRARTLATEHWPELAL